MKWVPAHTGITGNERADIAAEEAAGWRANEPACTANQAAPPERLYPLQATLKTWIKQEAQKEWDYTWKTETRGEHTTDTTRNRHIESYASMRNGVDAIAPF